MAVGILPGIAEILQRRLAVVIARDGSQNFDFGFKVVIPDCRQRPAALENLPASAQARECRMWVALQDVLDKTLPIAAQFVGGAVDHTRVGVGAILEQANEPPAVVGTAAVPMR